MTADVDHASTREQRARDLLDRGYTPGRVAELTGMPLGAVDRLAEQPLQPVTGPYSAPRVVPIRQREEPPPACAWGLGCTRPVVTDGHCALHHAVVQATAADKPVKPPRIVARQPEPKTAQRPPSPAPRPARNRPIPAPQPPVAAPPRPTTCEAPGCDKPRHQRKPLCSAHIARKRKYGSLDLPTSRTAHCTAGHDWQAPMHAGPPPSRCPDHDTSGIQRNAPRPLAAAPPAAAQAAYRRSPTGPLRINLSAGYVELTAHVDFFALSKYDVDWLLDIRQQLIRHSQRSSAS